MSDLIRQDITYVNGVLSGVGLNNINQAVVLKVQALILVEEWNLKINYAFTDCAN